MKIDVPLTVSAPDRLKLLWNAIVEPALHTGVLDATYNRLTWDNPNAETFVRRALRFAQSLPRWKDPEGREQFISIADTIAQGGDCEDHSAVLVAILELGSRRAYPCVGGMLQWMQLENIARYNHITAGASLDCGRTWMWAEPSVRWAELGEDPFDAALRTKDWSGLNV